MAHLPPIRVLLVDDSAVIRGLICKAIEAHGDTEVVGRASNGSAAIDQAKLLKPDIIVLDVEMPVMDGLTALPKILEASPASKVIMVSSLTMRNAKTSMQALSLGASECVAKPSSKIGDEVDLFYVELISKIRALSGRATTSPAPISAQGFTAPAPLVKKAATPANVMRINLLEKLNPRGIHAIAIASSTGGPQALITLFKQLKGGLTRTPLFITQHMPPTFTTILAQQLSDCGERVVKEAVHDSVVEAGVAYVAPGDYHMEVVRVNNRPMIQLNQHPAENYCRPAADPMLRSLSKVYGVNLCSIVLTGMGQDGCEGAKEVVNSGGSVIAQDAASCAVYGMPKAVVDAGICKAVLPLNDIASFIIRQVGE